MKTISHSRLKWIIKNYNDGVSSNQVKGKPIMVWGPPGVGKSISIKEFAREKAKDENLDFVKWNDTTNEIKDKIINDPEGYFVLLDKRASQMKSTDLKGIPDNVDDKNYSEWNIPKWAFLFTECDVSGMIFFDEINQANQSVQSACYQVIHDREIDTHSISEDVIIIGAGNSPENSISARPMSDPLKDRFGHYELQPPKVGNIHKVGEEKQEDTWMAWALSNELDQRVVHFVCGDLSRNEDGNGKGTLYDYSSAGRVFPTPRSWENISDILKAREDLDPEEIKILASGWVGEDLAREFSAWVAQSEDINLEEYFDDPSNISDIEEYEFSMKHRIISGISNKYKEHLEETNLKNDDFDMIETISEMALNIPEEEYGALLFKTCKTVYDSHVDNLESEEYKYQTSSDLLINEVREDILNTLIDNLEWVKKEI